MHKIYLDYAATTYVEPSVLRKMAPYFGGTFGNPSSLHTAGREARLAIERARSEVAVLLGADAGEIIFTGSGTESDNLAIIGAAMANKDWGKHIIVSKIEHPAVLEAAGNLEKNGFEITYVNVDSKGMVILSELKKALRKDTILVSILYANNEIGTIQPIRKISKIIKEFKKESAYPLFHTDACQVAGALDLNVKKLGVDLLTLNGSKIYGPKGVGCLYVSSCVKLEPLVVGGGQEKGLRAGTENVSSIVGFAEALKLADKNKHKESARLKKLRDYFFTSIKKSIPGITINGDAHCRLPNNINLSIGGVEGESVLLMLDNLGVYAATGSACSSKSLEPSHVLLAIGVSPERAHGSLRLTLGRKTTKADMEYVLKVLPKIVVKLREISALNV